MFSATKSVVAGVIVALFGGFLLAGVLTTQPGEVTPAALMSASPDARPSPTVSSSLSKPVPARDIVVAQDGSGDYATVAEAVKSSHPGASTYSANGLLGATPGSAPRNVAISVDQSL